MNMNILERLRVEATKKNAHILLADATDERMLHAARRAVDTKLAKITLIGDPGEIMEAATLANVDIEDIRIWSQSTCPVIEDFVKKYYETHASKISGMDAARSEIISNPLLFGALIVDAGDADGLIAGSLSTTASVIRAGLRGVGLASGMRVLSSMFLMHFPAIKGLRSDDMVFAFADGAVIPDPDPYQLADITIATARTYSQLTSNEPRIAMLSYSTKGSASSESTKKVLTAVEIVRERAPELVIDGELQFDAAFIPEVAKRKAPESILEGTANIFIFPNLDSANIGYKIAERLGGGQAIGPILQGLAKPMNDLSRGASVDDIVTMIAVTALQK